MTDNSQQPVVDQVEKRRGLNWPISKQGETSGTIISLLNIWADSKIKIKTMKKTTIILAVVLALSVALNIAMYVRNAVSVQDKQFIQQQQSNSWNEKKAQFVNGAEINSIK